LLALVLLLAVVGGCQASGDDDADGEEAAGTCTSYTQSGGSASLAGKSFCADETDESAVNVSNSGVLTLANSTITSSGNTSSQDNSSFYGLNAVVLASSASSITLSDCTVSSTGTGANGVFATGAGSAVSLNNVTINAIAQGGHAVMATQGGVLTMNDVRMTTAGANSGAIATDRGGGTITANGGTVTTTGPDSPGIYSTGAITVNGASISATGAEAAVIEGSNSIVLNGTSLTSSKDNKWGVMIYQSMSGDASGSQGTFVMNGGSLSLTPASGPLFYVTNATGQIALKGVTASVGSGVLLRAAAGNWGTRGANGGAALVTADGQILSGNLVADSISSIALTLQNGSSLNGAIDADDSAKSVSLTMDATSSWNVTADSHLTCLADPGGISGSTVTNITGNGHFVYYRASACSALGGQTYSLKNGGYLLPES